MKNESRRPGTAWAFVLSLLIPLPLVRPAYAQENSSTRARPSVGEAPRNARFADAPIPRTSRPWAPPDIDDAVPPVAPDVTCSLPKVLYGAGQRAKELVAYLEQFTATERIEHSELDRAGNWRSHVCTAFVSATTRSL